MFEIAYAVLVVLSSVWILGGIATLAAHARRRARRVHKGEPVSVLKPLCGVDEDLEANLRTFFAQLYQDASGVRRFELVFGVEGEEDPVIPLARRLMAEYPDVPCKLLVHQGARGINPKVRNLRAMLHGSTHDLVIISDSNVGVAPDYIEEMVSELDEDRNVGLVTSLFAGTGERSLGATLENLHLNGEIATGVAFPTEFLGRPVVVGKSMIFRRTTFERLGGFESIANVLAEDYVIGEMFRMAGFGVRLAPHPVFNVNRHTGLPAFLRRHIRWGMIRMRMEPLAYALEPLTRPLLLALLAPLFGVSLPWPLLWAVLLTLGRDGAQWVILRGFTGLHRAIPLFPLRDALVTLAWLIAPFKRHVSWRGRRVRVRQGTRLYAETAPPGIASVETVTGTLTAP